jgi:cell wall-associated NlpC family hydrolase
MQAFEIPERSRIRFDDAQPADLLFFGRGHIGHVGIALGNDWMIHSSVQGVYVSPLFERRAQFRWARRLL